MQICYTVYANAIKRLYSLTIIGYYMSWTKVNHSGNLCYIECSSCDHQFVKKEVCYKKTFVYDKHPSVFALSRMETEIVCQTCFERRKLKMGKDKTKKAKKK